MPDLSGRLFCYASQIPCRRRQETQKLLILVLSSLFDLIFLSSPPLLVARFSVSFSLLSLCLFLFLSPFSFLLLLPLLLFSPHPPLLLLSSPLPSRRLLPLLLVSSPAPGSTAASLARDAKFSSIVQTYVTENNHKGRKRCRPGCTDSSPLTT